MPVFMKLQPAALTCKRFFFLLLFCCGIFPAFAGHIAGGELSYVFTGTTNPYNYTVTLKLYRSCTADRAFDNSVVISVFNRDDNSRVSNHTVSLAKTETLSLTNPNPCITNPPAVCYQVAYYTLSLSLPSTAAGYLLVSQVNYRANGMLNLTSGYSNVGATYTSEIPGTTTGAAHPQNNSALFVGSDLEILCDGNRFSYSFAAEDKDGDVLRYSLCNAYSTGVSGNTVANPSAPPYNSLPYGNGYSGQTPLGSTVTINPNTGLISGVAPATGTYVIAVCVAELRNGVVIATQRKDIQVRASSCSIAAARLEPKYTLCKDSRTISISNLSENTQITTYNWTLTNARGVVVNTSVQKGYGYSFADTGTYTIRLLVATSNGCTDSASSTILVYPGFQPSFSVVGSCYQAPFLFTDKSTTPYGTVSFRYWDLGNTAAADDTSRQASVRYQYPAQGSYSVSFFVGTSKGCMDTVVQTVNVTDKPYLRLPFRDTLICSKDSLPLLVETNAGSIQWSPNYNILDAASSKPLVFPKDTTIYKVVVKELGCSDSATVQVNVLDFISVRFTGDTAICATDSITLRPVSDALSYAWSELPASGSMNNYSAQYPRVAPQVTTTYSVTANLGYCQDRSRVTVFVSPYPRATIGADTAICYGTAAQLQASTTAPRFAWAPAASLSDASVLNPVARPASTTAYVFTISDTAYCRKPVHDTVVVQVIPPIVAHAGRDTSIALGQVLQLQANQISNYSYQWAPAAYLDNAAVYNPVLRATAAMPDSIRLQVAITSPQGCVGTDDMLVRIFKIGPDILVPSGFTPNNDGHNDVLRPVLIGITRLNFFQVYNRWGQLVYSTSQAGAGWNGTLNGLPQNTGVYVFVAQGVDINGATVNRKGAAALIR